MSETTIPRLPEPVITAIDAFGEACDSYAVPNDDGVRLTEDELDASYDLLRYVIVAYGDSRAAEARAEASAEIDQLKETIDRLHEDRDDAIEAMHSAREGEYRRD